MYTYSTHAKYLLLFYKQVEQCVDRADGKFTFYKWGIAINTAKRGDILVEKKTKRKMFNMVGKYLINSFLEFDLLPYGVYLQSRTKNNCRLRR